MFIQVLSVVRRWPGLQKISFVAHSLGGLVARYAIGKLFAHSSTLEAEVTSRSCNCKEETVCTKNCIDHHYEARIAGLEPMNFITFATPHLGSRGHKQVAFEAFYELKFQHHGYISYSYFSFGFH